MVTSSGLPAFVVAALVLAAVVASACTDGRGGFDDDDPTTFAPETPCASIACKIAQCPPNGQTTLRGKVLDPAGRNGLYGVAVYVPRGDPSAPLQPLQRGVACSACATTVVDPLRAAITDARGEFTLGDMPVGDAIPLVIQIGKWRRRFSVAITRACNENVVPAQTLTLPKNGTEGDMPRIAVTAGGCDALECLLRGIGIDESEFVAGHGETGHVHVFNGHGGLFPGGPVSAAPNGTPKGPGSASDDLWNDVSKLAPYDIAMLSCECGEFDASKGGPSDQAGPVYPAVREYVERGGRVFATHFHYTWFKNSASADFRAIADWRGDVTGPSVGTGTQLIDMSFPKGKAMADWLFWNGVSPKLGELPVVGLSESLETVKPPAVSWIRSRPDTTTGKQYTRYFSFNAPIGAPPEAQCGRVAFGDLHLMGAGRTFPDGCPFAGGLTPQQLAFEFMLFDLSACVEDDSKAPSAPR